MRRGLPRIGDVLLTMEAPLGHHRALVCDREDDCNSRQRVVRFRLCARKLHSRFAFLLALTTSPHFYFQDQLFHQRADGFTTSPGDQSQQASTIDNRLSTAARSQEAIFIRLTSTSRPLPLLDRVMAPSRARDRTAPRIPHSSCRRCRHRQARCARRQRGCRTKATRSDVPSRRPTRSTNNGDEEVAV